MPLRNTMPLRLGLSGALLLAASVALAADATPFKLGTFANNGQQYLGLVLDDRHVVDIAAANARFQSSNAGAARLDIPSDMKELIARYERELGPRLRELASFAAANLSADYVREVDSLRVLPPVMPSVILNAAANYPEHAQGIIEQGARAAGAAPGGGAPANFPAPPPPQSMPGYWTRPEGDTRTTNPYLFLKSPTTVVGAHDDVVIPRGRDQVDWECEFAVVIGATAKHVSVENIQDYIFGYTIEFDVSDRGGRGDRKVGGGPDWLLQKNHDTFGPIGPYIVPKEFFPNPMNTRHYFTLNGEIFQDSNTSRMEYSIWELTSYATNMLTLNPGDIVAAGSPSGTNIERAEPRWMQHGDVGVCAIEGLGEQRHNIVAER